MLFQENLRKFRMVPAGLIAFAATVMAVLPVAGAEASGVVGEEENVVSEGHARWFSAYGLFVAPVTLETPRRGDCVAVASSPAEALLDIDCPDYVALDHFRDVDYGPNAIGVTLCQLDSDGPPTTSVTGSISVSLGIIRFGVTFGSDDGDMCYYAGCELLVTESAANVSARA